MLGKELLVEAAGLSGDVSFIYPISPSTSMGETMDKFATAGRKNVFGQVVKAVNCCGGEWELWWPHEWDF